MLLDALRRDLLFAKNQMSLVSRILENKDEKTFDFEYILCCVFAWIILDMNLVT